MTDHDEFCRCTDTSWSDPVWCSCDKVRAIRADERQTFADIPETFRLLAVSTDHDVTRAAYLFAADLVATRIARTGGTP